MTAENKNTEAISFDSLKNVRGYTLQKGRATATALLSCYKQIDEIERQLMMKKSQFEESERLLIKQKEEALIAPLKADQYSETESAGQKEEAVVIKEQESPKEAEIKAEPVQQEAAPQQAEIKPVESKGVLKEAREAAVSQNEKPRFAEKTRQQQAEGQKKPSEKHQTKPPIQQKTESAPKTTAASSQTAAKSVSNTYTDEKGNVKVRRFLEPQAPPFARQGAATRSAADGVQRPFQRGANTARPQGQGNAAQQGRPPFNRTDARQGVQQGSKPPYAPRKPFGAPNAPVATPPPIAKEGKSFGNKKKTHEKPEEAKAAGKKSLITRTYTAEGEEDRVVRSRPRSKKGTAAMPLQTIKRIEKAVVSTQEVPIKVLSERIGKTAAEIIKELFKEGIFKTINDSVDFEYAAFVASNFGVELELKIEKTAEEVMITAEAIDDAPDTEKRPPIVTVMGHVDHGKTSLLDAIRKTHVTSSEAGGITQHIGAYTVTIKGEQITFIDTPGHAAFTKMRARGAKITDVAIIVVAADDGVMPQTIEAISHAKAAGVSIVVAVNKMDKPEANPDKVKQQLAEQGLVSEEWGGDTIMVPLSAKSGKGIDELLEAILTVAEVKDLKANPAKKATGTVIEAELDKGRGPVATILVSNGTLYVGDSVIAGTATGKIRAMFDDKGKKIKCALPSCPVEIIGFSDVPNAGDFMYVADEKLVRKVAEERKTKEKIESAKISSTVTLDDLFGKIKEGNMKVLNLIIKTDVQGSLDAVKLALSKISNEEVTVMPIHGGVGAINETDVMLAKASNAIIIGFNVRADSTAKANADSEKVDIRQYSVIYDAVEDITKAMKGMLAPKYKEVITAQILVREIFKVSSVGTIAGCYVQSGKVTRNGKIRVYRNDVLIHDGTLLALRRFKDDVKEVNQGYECGISLSNYNDIKVDDIFESYVMEEIQR